MTEFSESSTAANTLGENEALESDLFHFQNKYLDEYGLLLLRLKKDGDIGNMYGQKMPPLDSFPRVIARFEKLGIDKNLAQDIFASWSTIDPLRVFVEQSNPDVPFDQVQPTDDEVKRAYDYRSRAMVYKLRMMSEYATEYGIEELRGLIDIFGIYNLDRYPQEQLHRQVTEWHEGKVPAENIIATARKDYSGFSLDTSDEYLRNTGSGTFIFEVNDPTALANAAVDVGKRERTTGRTPDLKNYIIVAHMMSDAMILGVNNEALEVKDYTDTENGDLRRERNSYVRHLGNNYRLVLLGCNAGLETGNKKNIAQTMNEGHNITTHATPLKPFGIDIPSEGPITFKALNQDKKEFEYLPGVVYPQNKKD